MQTGTHNLLRLEFEARIFVSLSIAGTICAVSYSTFSHFPSLLVLSAQTFGVPPDTTLTAGYLAVGLLLASVSLLRMWAGGVLTPRRVMSFRVQVDTLNTAGPYRIVRNPIYFADLIAMSCFSLCLPVIGLVMPLLFYAHYARIIRYEEISLARRYGQEYAEYSRRVPRLIPRLNNLPEAVRAVREFRITSESVLHNALYVLFVPGFVLASYTHEFWQAIVLGMPGVIHWAIVHTKIGIGH
jgi:protein-S-isoprenylcysteine O-methyltransferase Ste14